MARELPPPTILIVDDNDGTLRLIQRALQREGFLTHVISSGKAAITWLSGHSADLMLLDLKLPDIEGKALVDRLRGISRAIPFIVITGQGDERVAVDMMKRGALDYLIKDVDFIEFVPTIVKRALEQVEKDRRLITAQKALEESQAQLLAVSDREQRRFGAELHDGLGQQLTAIEFLCQSLKEDLRAAPAGHQKQIAQIGRFLREAIVQTRALARGLSPVNLGSGGLTEALSELALRVSEAGRLKCTFDSPSPVPLKDETVASHVFRIAQEAVNNAAKHSKASKIVIRLAREKNGLRLEVSDNGRGLVQNRSSSRGIGLQIMNHRASIVGGTLRITSQPGKGVTVSCTLPDS